MLTTESVEDAARAAGLEGPAHFAPATGSTNTDLLRLAEAGAPEWALVVSGHQQSGRGRLGRTWVSPPGTALYASVLFRPELLPTETPLLSLAAGVAVVEAARRACEIEVRCKWPNDVVVQERKLAGILAEGKVQGSRVNYVVIGTGVNFGQRLEDFPEELRATATSVLQAGGRPDIEGMLREYLRTLRRLYGEGGEDFVPRTLEAYRPLCATIGRRVRATAAAGRAVEGRAADVGTSGELLVETPHGIVQVAFGEVTHLR
jgi:BirA family biotin operon repressor/biotin-[acetyl-CoA-carboxylase] ligase